MLITYTTDTIFKKTPDFGQRYKAKVNFSADNCYLFTPVLQNENFDSFYPEFPDLGSDVLFTWLLETRKKTLGTEHLWTLNTPI